MASIPCIQESAAHLLLELDRIVIFTRHAFSRVELKLAERNGCNALLRQSTEDLLEYLPTEIASCFKGVVQREFIRMGMSVNPEA